MAPVALIHDPTGVGWLEFAAGEVLAARRLGEVVPVLDRVAEAVAGGRWAAGFLAYEAAPALDPIYAARPPRSGGPPLAWWLVGPPPRAGVAPPAAPGPAADLDWRPSLDRRAHHRAVAAIHRLIAAGETYQVNLTFPLEAHFTGDGRSIFERLWAAQRAPYSALVETDEWAVCSASPELFFRQQGELLVARPMKGTSRRGRFPGEDAARLEELGSDKNRAENLMITDMVRNDLGRLARPGSVRVDHLFAAETYPTVHQLVSEISAATEAGPLEVLRTLFPAASITGAPKKRATEIIRRIERSPRGVYTGAIGFVAPDRRAQFSVAIRTVSLDKRAGRALYGVGGGIVWDSRAEDEYDECRAKALALAAPRPPFELLETLQWRPRRGYLRLAAHLDRLQASAAYFGFRFVRQELEQQIEDHGRRLATQRHRVRLLLAESGELRIDARAWPCRGRFLWRLGLDDRPVDERDPFLFHKTTHRQVYDAARGRWPGLDEVVLFNRRGRLTEGTRSNLVLRFGDQLRTPPVSEGLLAGVYRSTLVARGRLVEAEMPVSALREADAIFFVNSLRGWIRGQLALP